MKSGEGLGVVPRLVKPIRSNEVKSAYRLKALFTLDIAFLEASQCLLGRYQGRATRFQTTATSTPRADPPERLALARRFNELNRSLTAILVLIAFSGDVLA